MNKKIHLIGNAHLDPVWLWRWQEGCNEVMQTFRSALDRMNEYPEFVFTCSSAAYYRWVEIINPEMFTEIKERIQEGRWVPVGGWFVQSDCNIPSGESFARQALYSQMYYHDKFGITCKTGYNVDSFGHNGNLPQLLKEGGMNAYVMMRPQLHENSRIPQGNFIWKGVDGTEIPVFRIADSYGSSGTASIDRELNNAKKYTEKTDKSTMIFYGIGNHGGGPTRGDIEYLIDKISKDADICFSSPDKYFAETDTSDLPVWNDDLQHHASGCYSVTSSVKALNRKAENTLLAAETWDTVASVLLETETNSEALAESWQKLCFNQFHDILCGCSIMEAYDDVRCAIGSSIDTAANIQNTALIRLSGQIDTWIDGVSDPVYSETRHFSGSGFPLPIVVFNSTSFDIETPVRCLRPAKSILNTEGEIVPSQIVWASRRNNGDFSDTIFKAKVPAMGYALYWMSQGTENDSFPSSLKYDTDNLIMENSFTRVQFSKDSGAVISLKYKDREILSDDGALPIVIDDSYSDTWAHNVFKFDKKLGKMDLKEIRWIETGPLLATIRITYEYNKSELQQEFTMFDGNPAIYVKCKTTWREGNTLLKLAFPIKGHNHISTSEIPYGCIKRPTDGDEEPMQTWADITSECTDGTKIGLSVINDSKYSYDCTDNTLNFTCLRNAIFADHYWKVRDGSAQQFTDEGTQRFEYAIYPHEGEADTAKLSAYGLIFNQRPFVVYESYHKGNAPQSFGFLKTDKDNVLITACKKAEDNPHDMILRLLETAGKDTSVTVTCDTMTLKHTLTVKKNKIVTLRISPDGEVKQVNFLEGTI